MIADGPRNEQERALCEESRAIVTNGIDWPCETSFNFSKDNLGVRWRIHTGIDWVFQQAGEAIILEDDCLADPTFFRFCGELLARYRDDSRVMHISGNCYVQRPSTPSYYLSRFALIWGWATWKRAWSLYDGNLKQWDDPQKRGEFLRTFKTGAERRFWTDALNGVQAGTLLTWDYQWLFTILLNRGLCINPTRNLVKNIGFGADASHTFESTDWLDRLQLQSVTFPLSHPETLSVDDAADNIVARLHFKYRPPWKLAIRQIIDRLLGKQAFPKIQSLFQ